MKIRIWENKIIPSTYKLSDENDFNISNLFFECRVKYVFTFRIMQNSVNPLFEWLMYEVLVSCLIKDSIHFYVTGFKRVLMVSDSTFKYL